MRAIISIAFAVSICPFELCASSGGTPPEESTLIDPPFVVPENPSIKALRRKEPATPRRLVESKKERASVSLTLRFSLQGVIHAQECAFYFRVPDNESDLGESSSKGTVIDRAHDSLGYSAKAEPRSAAAIVEVSTYAPMEKGHEHADLVVLVPYFEDKKGNDAGFAYSLEWRRLKEGQPNQAADSTASAGTSAAGQPRVPASAASHL